MNSEPSASSPFSHLDNQGQARMVDVSAKPATLRAAAAEGELHCCAGTLELLRNREFGKGDVFAVAQIAGIMAAKRTAELIPLCHPLPLSYVDVRFALRESQNRVLVRAEARTTSGTGVEMEALAAAGVALLTLYDMMKSADKGMVIENLRLVEKKGGRSGVFENPACPGAEEFKTKLPANPADPDL